MVSTVTILGSTGSIGRSTLDVIGRHRSRYNVHALTANDSVDALLEQCLAFEPRFAVMRDPDAATLLGERLLAHGLATRTLSGAEALTEVVDADIVMASIVGGAGLAPTFAAAEAGKRLLLANKESLVMAGSVFMETAHRAGATLLPIDSEHNAIYQCLANGADAHAAGVRRIVLTASGGPLLRTEVSALGRITPDEACAHPNWSMGRKISVDSATMMNKGLELIEACWLFDKPKTEIDILIHPQSIVHSMVEYADGSVVAQLGNPDMRTPIAHGLAWPERIDSGVDTLDLGSLAALSFEEVEPDRFPCLALARQVAGEAQSLAIALNAANEVAVAAFLDELIPFTAIPLLIERVLGQTCAEEANTIADVLAIDDRERRAARKILEAMTS